MDSRGDSSDGVGGIQSVELYSQQLLGCTALLDREEGEGDEEGEEVEEVKEEAASVLATEGYRMFE